MQNQVAHSHEEKQALSIGLTGALVDKLACAGENAEQLRKSLEEIGNLDIRIALLRILIQIEVRQDSAELHRLEAAKTAAEQAKQALDIEVNSLSEKRDPIAHFYLPLAYTKISETEQKLAKLSATRTEIMQTFDADLAQAAPNLTEERLKNNLARVKINTDRELLKSTLQEIIEAKNRLATLGEELTQLMATQAEESSQRKPSSEKLSSLIAQLELCTAAMNEPEATLKKFPRYDPVINYQSMLDWLDTTETHELRVDLRNFCTKFNICGQYDTHVSSFNYSSAAISKLECTLQAAEVRKIKHLQGCDENISKVQAELAEKKQAFEKIEANLDRMAEQLQGLAASIETKTTEIETLKLQITQEKNNIGNETLNSFCNILEKFQKLQNHLIAKHPNHAKLITLMIELLHSNVKQLTVDEILSLTANDNNQLSTLIEVVKNIYVEDNKKFPQMRDPNLYDKYLWVAASLGIKIPYTTYADKLILKLAVKLQTSKSEVNKLFPENLPEDVKLKILEDSLPLVEETAEFSQKYNSLAAEAAALTSIQKKLIQDIPSIENKIHEKMLLTPPLKLQLAEQQARLAILPENRTEYRKISTARIELKNSIRNIRLEELLEEIELLSTGIPELEQEIKWLTDEINKAGTPSELESRRNDLSLALERLREQRPVDLMGAFAVSQHTIQAQITEAEEVLQRTRDALITVEAWDLMKDTKTRALKSIRTQLTSAQAKKKELEAETYQLITTTEIDAEITACEAEISRLEKLILENQQEIDQLKADNSASQTQLDELPEFIAENQAKQTELLAAKPKIMIENKEQLQESINQSLPYQTLKAKLISELTAYQNTLSGSFFYRIKRLFNHRIHKREQQLANIFNAIAQIDIDENLDFPNKFTRLKDKISDLQSQASVDNGVVFTSRLANACQRALSAAPPVSPIPTFNGHTVFMPIIVTPISRLLLAGYRYTYVRATASDPVQHRITFNPRYNSQAGSPPPNNPTSHPNHP